MIDEKEEEIKHEAPSTREPQRLEPTDQKPDDISSNQWSDTIIFETELLSDRDDFVDFDIAEGLSEG